MNSITNSKLSRRGVLAGTGALVVSFSMITLPLPKGAMAAAKPALTPDQLDSFIKIGADNTVTAYFGKMDMGQGVDVAIGQIVAEELDVSMAQMTVVMGDTATTVNQGGASGSTGVENGGIPLRNAAAEARRLLLEMAAKKWSVAAEKLSVTNGVVSDGSRKVTYGELIGGDYFNVALEWNKQYGNGLVSKGQAKPKDPKDYKVVGKTYPRSDVPSKIFAQHQYVTDVKVPGMVHGRMVLPARAGATPVKVDEGSIKHIPGARVVQVKDFLSVVADKEWDAVRAARDLKVEWSNAKPPFPNQGEIYTYLRTAPAIAKNDEKNDGNVDEAFAGAAKVVTAEYEWPFQSHASMGPGCAVVEIKDGKCTLWTGSQKPHYTAEGVAAIIGMKADDVHGIWVTGPGSYGRNDAGDVAMQAAVMAKAVGKPVRVQGMRAEGTGWDPKGPASVHLVKGAFDAQGNMIAYHFHSRAFDRQEVASNESKPQDNLAGQLIGHDPKPLKTFGTPQESYKFASKRMGWELVAPWLAKASPLRSSHLRDPLGPQLQFASESFMDEMALAAGADPLEFRLKYVSSNRDAEVIKAAAEKAGWKPRVGAANKPGGNSTVTGRGLAYAQRGRSVVAIVAEVDVDRATGRIWARKFTVAHDCGLIINPGTLHTVIEGNIVQGISRALLEEVTFDNDNVTSVDWVSYPILEMPDAPEIIDTVLINRPNDMPRGAGEPSTRPVAGAIANAFFDATGVRLRRAPLTPERVKQALATG
jgi:nicotinate dehydrogenase subunit B